MFCRRRRREREGEFRDRHHPTAAEDNLQQEPSVQQRLVGPPRAVPEPHGWVDDAEAPYCSAVLEHLRRKSPPAVNTQEEPISYL